MNDPRMSDTATDGTSPALLFIPDISGFTQFVQATEITHSRHIIEELLEKLIEANDIGLQVSEIEGDAILFHRFGPAPPPEEFFRQVQKMFIALHAHLRLYETQRICQCGACRTAQYLTLKIVAHYGYISQSHVKDHIKLFGPDVIAVHRLLKNDITHHEYALFTQALANEWSQGSAPAWAPLEQGVQEYDIGSITYYHVPLAPLRQRVPEPRVEDFSIRGMTVPVFSFEHEVQCPMNLVFDVVCDLPARLHWMQGAQRVEMQSHQLNRLGTKHRCVVDRSSPLMVTSGSTRAADTITFTETDEKKAMCAVFTLRQTGDALTHVRIDGFRKDSVVLKIFFTLFLKKKLSKLFRASSENLKRYCEKVYGTRRGESAA